jgi:hypothetical protein
MIFLAIPREMESTITLQIKHPILRELGGIGHRPECIRTFNDGLKCQNLVRVKFRDFAVHDLNEVVRSTGLEKRRLELVANLLLCDECASP